MDSFLSGVYDFFKKAGTGGYMVYVSQFPRDAMGFIRSYAENLSAGTTLRVYAVGGDGILFDCLNGIMGFPGAELAAIPYGRTNNFVRGFGKKNMALFRSLPLQLSAPAAPMDVIRAGNNYAMNFCLIGTEAMALLNAARIQRSLEEGSAGLRWLNQRLYRSFYLIGGVAACRDRGLLRQRYQVTLDGEDLSGVYRGIYAANGPWYRGGKSPQPSARADDGRMDILFARGGGVLRTLSLMPAYLRGRHDRYPDFFQKQGQKLSIQSGGPLVIGMDDVIFFDTELTVELLPGAARFVDVSRRAGRNPSDE